MSEYLDKLSVVQRDAAVNYNGASLIVAGAGSGKTRVLTYRIAHMLDCGVAPHNILALTFTNKAAKEMRERIEGVVGGRARALWMGTFHSVFARILRAEAERLGYPSSFTIYDTADSKNVVKAIIKEMNLNDETYKPNEIYSRISLAKNNLVTSASYEANTMLMAEDREHRRPQFVEVYKAYTKKCKDYGAMDFDDLLLNMNILFRDHPDVLTRYQQLFRYVMVDEYQDTNAAQYLIVKRIAEQHGNICVVGDDAQSIYSFRGAKIENILRFQKDYPAARVFKLEQNYRSTPTIVNAANSIIEKNQRQLKKKTFSNNPDGERIKVYKTYADQEEAVVVASDMAMRVRVDDLAYSDLAILYRTNAQSRVIEEALRRRNIPYRIYGGQSFYQRKEIKDVLAYIRLVVNHKDDEALKRVINYPARGIGDVTINRIAEAARTHDTSMWHVMTSLTPEQMGLNAGAGRKIKEFFEMIASLSEQIYTMPAYELGMQVALRSGIIGSFKMQQTPEAVSVLENIEELMNSIASFVDSRREEEPEAPQMVTIDDWLQNVALLTDMDNDKDVDRNRVTLMTVHSAKGLEFEYVYIVGLEENLFPSQMCTDTLEGLEEERRLFYVALTRAKLGATLSFSQTRFRWGSVVASGPSRFLKEIDPQYLEITFSDEPDAVGSSDEPAMPRKRYQSGSEPVYIKGDRPSFHRRENVQPQQQPVVKPISTANMRSVGRRVASSDDDSPRANVSVGNLKEGCRVEHEKFGQGVVIELEETANGAKATVEFDAAGSKTLLLKYAKLNVISE